MSEQQKLAHMSHRRSQYEPEAFDLVLPGIGAIGIVKSETDARRVVACWNACRGIDTDALWPGVLGVIGTDASNTAAQRDRLLAALEQLCDVLGKCAETEKPRALIAECRQSMKAPTPPEQSIPGIEVLYVDATPRPTYWRS